MKLLKFITRKELTLIDTIRVLNYIPAFKYGGIETLVMNLYENINRGNIQFDFLVENQPPEHVQNSIKAMGGKIIYIPKMTSKNMFFAHIKSIYNILKLRKYDIIHVHSFDTRPFVMIIAYLCGVKVRIVHAHSTNFNDNRHLFIKKLVRKASVVLANKYIACSTECAIYMFGKKYCKKTFIVKNGINLDKYNRNENLKKLYKKELNIDSNCRTIGFIGRFSYLKNPKYVIEIAEKLKLKNFDFKIIMVGDGEDKYEFTKLAKERNIEAYIECLGYRNDVLNLLNIIDVIVMPSINEGVPLVAIEAQALGVKCIVSDNVSKEINITKNIEFIPLSDIEKWICSIVEDIKIRDLNLCHTMIKESGYDIKCTAKEVEDYYMKQYKEIVNVHKP